MYFAKSADAPAQTREQALALAKADGGEIIGTGSDRIVTKDKSGRTRSYYFDGEPTVTKTFKPTELEPEELPDMSKHEDVEVDTESFERLVKAVEQRHYCSPRDARIAVSMAMEQGTLTKLLGRDGVVSLVAQENLTKANASGFLAKVADIRKAYPKLSRQEALRQARLDHPEAFEQWQG